MERATCATCRMSNAAFACRLDAMPYVDATMSQILACHLRQQKYFGRSSFRCLSSCLTVLIVTDDMIITHTEGRKQCFRRGRCGAPHDMVSAPFLSSMRLSLQFALYICLRRTVCTKRVRKVFQNTNSLATKASIQATGKWHVPSSILCCLSKTTCPIVLP